MFKVNPTVYLKRRDVYNWIKRIASDAIESPETFKTSFESHIEDLRNGNVSLEDLAIVKSVSSNYFNEAHPMKLFMVELEKQGKKIAVGDCLSIVFLYGNGRLNEKYCLLEDSENELIDLNFYLEKAYRVRKHYIIVKITEFQIRYPYLKCFM